MLDNKINNAFLCVLPYLNEVIALLFLVILYIISSYFVHYFVHCF